MRARGSIPGGNNLAAPDLPTQMTKLCLGTHCWRLATPLDAPLPRVSPRSIRHQVLAGVELAAVLGIRVEPAEVLIHMVRTPMLGRLNLRNLKESVRNLRRSVPGALMLGRLTFWPCDHHQMPFVLVPRGPRLMATLRLRRVA